MTNVNQLLNQVGQGEISKFNYEKKDREFINLRDLYSQSADAKHTVQAMYINNKSKYGDAPVVYTDDYMVNFPTHLTNTVKDLRGNNEIVEQINQGNIAFQIYEYQGKNGKGYSVNFVPSESGNKATTTRDPFNTDEVDMPF